MGAIYSQLSLQERRRIEDWWLAKVPVAEMARVLKRCRSACAATQADRTPRLEPANGVADRELWSIQVWPARVS
jgi:hypothetical protein